MYCVIWSKKNGILLLKVMYLICINLLVSGGGPDDQTPQLADVDQSVVLEVAENDDPYGVFDFPAASRELSIAEDYYPGDEATTRANFTVERRQGTFKIVQVIH